MNRITRAKMARVLATYALAFTMVAAPAFAVHDLGLFKLDRNALDSNGAALPDDSRPQGGNAREKNPAEVGKVGRNDIVVVFTNAASTTPSLDDCGAAPGRGGRRQTQEAGPPRIRP